jgi:hypothetical protein
MQPIGKVPELVDKLLPHWSRIEEHVNTENNRFKALLVGDHDAIGRVLRHHLVVEHYVTCFLREQLNLSGLEDARLSFFQKASLLPDQNENVAFVKPGILELNAVRNKLAHALNSDIQKFQVPKMTAVLEIARKGIEFPDPVAKIEVFTAVACTFLLASPEDIDLLFTRVFREVYGDNTEVTNNDIDCEGP